MDYNMIGKQWRDLTEEQQEWIKEEERCGRAEIETRDGDIIGQRNTSEILQHETITAINFLPPRTEPRFKVGDKIRVHKEVKLNGNEGDIPQVLTITKIFSGKRGVEYLFKEFDFIVSEKFLYPAINKKS